jgi:hypothetical protein
VHSFPVTAIDFNYDATVVLSGSADGSVAIISVPDPSIDSSSSATIVYILIALIGLFASLNA